MAYYELPMRKDYSLQVDLPVIASDQFQLQQVFLNLINNAIGAIGKDGKLKLLPVKLTR